MFDCMQCRDVIEMKCLCAVALEWSSIVWIEVSIDKICRHSFRIA